MIDRDITMLQLGAANMHPDDFMINIINKFELVPWTQTDFDCKEDDSIRQINVIAEEFLSILIYILGERHVPQMGDLTSEDCIRNEIIHWLSIQPMAHSSLNRHLAENVHKETGLEKVVESVATFKRVNQSSSSNGKYELKPECYQEFNEFFYKYSRENQSKAEESQRQRKKAAGEPECNPPPKKPRLTPQFQPMVKIMESEVFITIIKLVLDRADNLRSRCFSEAQVHKMLHLIGLCLQEEERPETKGYFSFTKAAEKADILEKLQKLVGSQRIDSHKDLLNWTISTWQRIIGSGDQKMDTDESQNVDTEMFRAKSEERDRAVAEKKEIERKRAATERRKKVMDQMKNQQKNFMKENKQLFEDTVQKRPRLNTDDFGPEAMLSTSGQAEASSVPPVTSCLGPDRAQTGNSPPEEVFHTCILCQEEEELKAEGNTLVTAAFLQKSTVLSNRRMTSLDGLNGRIGGDLEIQPGLPLMTSDLHFGVHTSSCGHVMHADCWKTYFEDIQASERNRSRLRTQQNFNALKQV